VICHSWLLRVPAKSSFDRACTSWYLHFGRPFVKRFALCYQTVVCPVCPVLGWIKMKLGMQVRLGPGHIVLDGDPAPPRKQAQFVYAFAAIFLPSVSAYAVVGRL